jgi:hypothetical protein
MDDRLKTEIEAAAFRGLIAHLRRRTDVQNIDLMNLAGFCRNCLAKWVAAAAEQHGVAMSEADARTFVYGMPLAEWKAKYQIEASDAQLRRFEETKPLHAEISGH